MSDNFDMCDKTSKGTSLLTDEQNSAILLSNVKQQPQWKTCLNDLEMSDACVFDAHSKVKPSSNLHLWNSSFAL